LGQKKGKMGGARKKGKGEVAEAKREKKKVPNGEKVVNWKG